MVDFYKLYKTIYKDNPKSIVEIGSRDGDDAEKLRVLSGLSSNDVYIAEAHPVCAKYIRLRYPDVNLYQVAVFNNAGIFDFNAIDHKYDKGYVGTSSLLKRNIDNVPDSFVNIVKEQSSNLVKVIGITSKMLLQLINKPEIDLMKIDVEGATYEVLSGFGDEIRSIKLLHVECETSEIWEGQHLVDSIVKYMRGYGFEDISRKQVYINQMDIIWRRID